MKEGGIIIDFDLCKFNTQPDIELYRFVYPIHDLRVVGYVAVPTEGGHFPCIIHLRGGSRDLGQLDKIALARLSRFAFHGYVVITTQYPGVDGGEGVDTFGGDDDVDSILYLKKILEFLSVADDSKVGTRGHSRGGLMAYMMLRKVDWINVAVISGAPVDQFKQASERPGWKKHQIKMWGEDPRDIEKTRRSPACWANELCKVPILLMHGASDRRVDVHHSLHMASLLKDYAVPFRLIIFEGSDHGISEHKKEFLSQTIEWFNRFLKHDEPFPNMEPHGE